jgi:hypothetical protein
MGLREFCYLQKIYGYRKNHLQFLESELYLALCMDSLSKKAVHPVKES